MIQEILHLANSGGRFALAQIADVIVSNGIYLLFEECENCAGGLDPIVRAGINVKKDRFKSRLEDHFVGEHRGSVFRKHVGRALLVKSNKSSYLPIWNFNNSQVSGQRQANRRSAILAWSFTLDNKIQTSGIWNLSI